MIPDFKTFIKESIWSDIQDRSMGKTVRKEDDINLMSGEDFCDYLNDNYIGKYDQEIIYDDISKRIIISILKKFANVRYSITYSYKSNTITMNDEVESICPELCKKIKENFKVDKEYVNIGYTKFLIFPPDGSECTNRFFVDVLDFIIDNGDENMLLVKKKHINESIWSDIQDRSMGKTVRREDEIITNIKDIKPVDVGVSVLWADKDLEINDEKYILIDQVKNFEKDGWRLPSKDDANELLSNARWSSTKDNRTLSKFYQIGITHMKNDSEENTIYFDCELGKYSKYWENKRDVNTQKNYWDAFDFKHEGSFFPHSVFSRVKIDEPCRVRLVKDK